jgi:hypothetical protein
MRRVAMCCCAVVMVGCGQAKEQPATDQMAEAPPEQPAPAPIQLADVAGKWTVNVRAPGGDTTVLTYELVATADTSGWSINFPKRKPVPIRVVAVDGDSIVLEAGPFESALRKGVQVRSSRTVGRLQDGKLAGVTTAHYETTSPDSVVQLPYEGTRAP